MPRFAGLATHFTGCPPAVHWPRGQLAGTALRGRHTGEVTEERLAGGRMTTGLIRRGDRVLRPMGSWSPAVHEFLRHLEHEGFGGAPRVLGTEGSFEVLT
jgi:hypothetical protein